MNGQYYLGLGVGVTVPCQQGFPNHGLCGQNRMVELHRKIIVLVKLHKQSVLSFSYTKQAAWYK